MVLSVSNVHAKRGDNENTPPPKTHVSKFKKLNRRQARHIPGASRNLNARRLPPKARNEPRRFQVTQEATPPPSVPDVEMADASSSQIENPTTHVALPRFLAFPGVKSVSNETLAAVDPALLQMPITFIRDSLKAKGPAMMKVLTGVKMTPTAALPKVMDIVLNNLSSTMMPTHVMAVYSRLPTQLSSRRVTLYPIHNIVLATHCAALPPLPASDPDMPSAPGASINVPVVPLCIPHPQSFPTLVSYLYTKRADVLLAALMPAGPPASNAPASNAPASNAPATDQAEQKAMIQRYGKHLARTFTPHTLLERMMVINGLWRNVCALGISDEGLWKTMDGAWEIMIYALAVATGVPHTIEVTPLAFAPERMPCQPQPRTAMPIVETNAAAWPKTASAAGFRMSTSPSA